MKGNIRVLAAEDDPVYTRLAALMSRAAGDVELLQTSDGLEALDLALTQAPDVLLLDLALPGLSGLELLRRYRAQGGRAGVLVLTGVPGAHLRDALLAAGADMVLTKPAPWDEVLFHLRLLSGDLSRPCQALLQDMGARARWFGLRQAAQCASRLALGDGALLKGVYIDVAGSEGCDPQSVEKNIRQLIARLHALDRPAYRRVTGRTGADPRPTNGEFLQALAQAALRRR